MSQLPQRFIEDRQLRDKARAVLAEDIERLKGALGEESIASRVSTGVTSSITGRIKSGARDIFEQAKAQASDSKGVLALLVGALVLWFARGPIGRWIEDLGGAIEDALEGHDTEAAAPEVADPGDPDE